MKNLLIIISFILSSICSAQSFGFNRFKRGISISSIAKKEPASVVELSKPKPTKKPLLIKEVVIEETEEPFIENIISIPLLDITITSNYGYRIHPITGKKKFHKGIDLISSSDFIYAIGNGIISEVKRNSKCGVMIKTKHNNFEAIYCHLSKVYVKKGQRVYADDIIGTMGSTGSATGKHLHFAIKKNGLFINPRPFLKLGF